MHLSSSRSQTVLDFPWRKSLTGLVCRWFTLGSREWEWESGEGPQGRRKSQCMGKLLNWAPRGAFVPSSCQTLPPWMCLSSSGPLSCGSHAQNGPASLEEGEAEVWGEVQQREQEAECAEDRSYQAVPCTAGCCSNSWIDRWAEGVQGHEGCPTHSLHPYPCQQPKFSHCLLFSRLLSERITLAI